MAHNSHENLWNKNVHSFLAFVGVADEFVAPGSENSHPPRIDKFPTIFRIRYSPGPSVPGAHLGPMFTNTNIKRLFGVSKFFIAACKQSLFRPVYEQDASCSKGRNAFYHVHNRTDSEFHTS